MEQKPTHIEDPLTILKETLVNAISTIDRLQGESNPVLERYTKQEVKDILGIPKVDSWCVQVTKENREVLSHYLKSSCLYNSHNEWSFHVNKYYGVDKDGEFHWCDYTHPTLGIYDKVLTTEEFYNKIGYTKPTPQNLKERLEEEAKENILEKGKEVLNSQNPTKYVESNREWLELRRQTLANLNYNVLFDQELNEYKEKVNKIRTEFNQRLDEIFSA